MPFGFLLGGFARIFTVVYVELRRLHKPLSGQYVVSYRERFSPVTGCSKKSTCCDPEGPVGATRSANFEWHHSPNPHTTPKCGVGATQNSIDCARSNLQCKRLLAPHAHGWLPSRSEYACMPDSTEMLPWEPSRKVWLCVLGMPGAGKTTRIRGLLDRFDCTVHHVGSYARANKMQSSARAQGALIEGLDAVFMEEVIRDPSPLVVLDGFPRSTAQLELVLEKAAALGVFAAFAVLDFTDLSEEARNRASETRQTERDTKTGKPVDKRRYLAKIKRATESDLVVIGKVRELGLANITIDASLPGQTADRALAGFVTAATSPPAWPLEVLDVLRVASEKAGVSAWLTSGGLYRAFWNGRFGPMQEPMDLDVVVNTTADVVALEEQLAHSEEKFNWSVFSWEEHARTNYGGAPPLPGGFASRVFTYRQGLVRLAGDRVDARMTAAAINDLVSGIVRLDEKALARLEPGSRQYHTEKSAAVLPKLLSEYPGLSLARNVEEISNKPHQPSLVATSWDAIEREVLALERAGRPAWDTYEWGSAQRAAAKYVTDFYEAASREPTPPQTLRGPVMPAALHQSTPPTSHANWFHLLSESCLDAEYRSWVVNQVRSRTPLGGLEPDLISVLDLSRFTGDKRIRYTSGTQKPTHMGWSLSMHLRQSLLSLETDWLIGTTTAAVVGRLRLVLRTATLFHDVGKLIDVFTPGTHEGAGAALFLSHSYPWMEPSDTRIVAHLIRFHDLFGRVSRGITEKAGPGPQEAGFDPSSPPSYGGALDPRRAVRVVTELSDLAGIPFDVALRMLREIWLADVASVAALRWLIPVAEPLSDLILATREAL